MTQMSDLTLGDIIRELVKEDGKEMEDVTDVFLNHPTDPTKILVVFKDSDLDSVLVAELGRPTN